MSIFSAFLARRRIDYRIALVVQVDNLAVLARCVGLGDAAGVMASFAARIAAELGRAVAAPIQTGPRGQIHVMLHVAGRAAAMRLALRVQALCQAGLDLPGHAPTPTISAVLVRPGDDDQTDAHLYAEARRHLAARPRMAAQVALIAAAPMTLPAPETPMRVKEEPASVDLSRIVAVFQPQLCCDSGRVTGFEALARLDHPARGLLAPADFLPLLSVSEQRQLTLVMLRRAAAALHHWDAAGHRIDTVSINVPATDLVAPDFADLVLWELDRQDIAPARLVIEVMEELSPLDMPEQVRANLARLTDLGCQIDLDDFGTGYASLDALRRLRVSRVKIDRSFVSGCDRDPDQQRMMLAVLAMAERLGLQALAEGVETAGEHAFVQQIGFSHAQGYAIARPMPLSATDAFLTAQHQQTELLPLIPRRAG